MHNIINTTKKYLLAFIVAAIATSLTSCNSNPTARQDIISETPTPTPTTTSNIILSPSPSQTPSMAHLRAKSEDVETPTPVATSPAATSKTTNVTLYTSDAQCQKLIPQKVPVSANEPVEGAVGKILEQRDSGDFNLSNYRINIKNGVATVDLRVGPNSKRQIASLSSCEQFALFGSVRKTLTSNAQWKIKDVRFTERGEEIVF
jgi:predicted small secreted protein